jgi:hypothetical protein
MATAAIRVMFAVCGMQNAGPAATNPAAQFVQATGIREPDDLLNFTVDDMASVVKAYNRRDEYTSVPMLVGKNLEALVYFAKYQWRRQKEITPANWTPEAMIQIKAIMQQVKAAKADRIGDNIDPGPIDVGAGYQDWVGRFRNKLRSTMGAADVPLIYVIRPTHEDEADWHPDPENEAEVNMYELRLDGPEYLQDRQAVFTLLYTCCNHERAVGRREALAWIEQHINSQDGRAAFDSFRTHFEGEGPTAMRRQQAFASLKSLHWKSETSMTFAQFSSSLKNAYDIVSVDAAYADEYKVRDLLDKLQPTTRVQQMEVVKGKVRDDYPTDFNRAIAYIAARIADIYSDDIAKMNRFGISKRTRQVYEAKSDGRGRGGRGNGARMSLRGGRGGGARGGVRGYPGRVPNQRTQTLFNGIDASDPIRPFNGAEWDQLGPNGRAYVTRERERLQGRFAGGRNRGGGRNDGRGGRRGGNNTGGRMVNEVVIQQQQNEIDASTVSSRGGKSGSGFGRGAHDSMIPHD